MAEEILNDKKFKKIKEFNSLGNHMPSLNGATQPRKRNGSRRSSITNDSMGPLPIKQESLSDSYHNYVKQLENRLSRRYRAGSFISYFDDVAFDARSSIFDESINEPFQMDFKGPTLEKEIKDREKLKRSVLRNQLVNGTDRDNESDTETDLSNTKLHTSFAGLYVALWMSIACTVLKIVFNFYWTDDNSITDLEIVQFMTTDIFTVAAVDLFLYLLTYFVFCIQWLCQKRIITWNGIGWALVSIYESAFLIIIVVIPEKILNLHWIAKIFLFLHGLVLLMKMHSYSFYNGYLWKIWEELQYSKKALKIIEEKDSETDSQRIRDTIEILNKSIKFCDFEIRSQSKNCKVLFPNTISISNYFTYTMFPTLVYQIEYPRTSKIRWNYVVEKLFAVFGTIVIMIINAQVFMYPIAIQALAIRDSAWTSWGDRLTEWCHILIDIVPSFIGMYLLTFYLIWDAILNCIAELTRFGDRYFYGDWWNCVTWGEFSRIWNIPVHKFLLRHVYHSTISSFQLSRGQATFVTFLISAIVHELSMYIIFRRLRFYLFFFQMLQLPLVSLGNTKFFKDKTILGNVVFWVGICMGPSIMCSLYLTI